VYKLITETIITETPTPAHLQHTQHGVAGVPVSVSLLLVYHNDIMFLTCIIMIKHYNGIKMLII